MQCHAGKKTPIIEERRCPKSKPSCHSTSLNGKNSAALRARSETEQGRKKNQKQGTAGVEQSRMSQKNPKSNIATHQRQLNPNKI